jgi:hypothetical protein
MAVKLGLAVKPEWKNSYQNWSLVEVKAGTLIYVGDAASQRLDATGAVLVGGERQIYIPNSKHLWGKGEMKEVHRGTINDRENHDRSNGVD